VIQEVVRRDSLAMRQCYQDGLHRNRRLRGTISTRFVIARDGHVERAVDESGAPFPDRAVADCVVGRFRRLSFPPPDGGKVTVVYPLTFSPD
jgi:outer membrane biosynthesis protein TonB